MSGRYQVAERAPRHRFVKRNAKGRRRLTIAGTVASILALAGVAVAAFFALLNITGGVSSASFEPRWLGSGLVVVEEDGAQGAINVANEGQDLVLDVTDAYNSGSVLFRARAFMASPGSSEPGIVTGLELPGLPAGWSAVLESGCGATLPVGMGGAPEVDIRITRGESAPDGSGTFEAGAGLQVTPESSAPTPTCEPFEGS